MITSLPMGRAEYEIEAVEDSPLDGESVPIPIVNAP
jgi:hypothetical protein